MDINVKTIENLAHLMMLDLSDNEKEWFASDLRNIIDYLGKLKELDVSNVEPKERMVTFSNVFREDEVHQYPDRDELLKSARDVENGYYKVPIIME